MIFRHRRLFGISLCAILAVFLAQALPNKARLIFVFAAFGIFLLLFLASLRVRAVRAVALCFLCAALAFFSSYAYEHPYDALSPFEGESYAVTVKVRKVLNEDEDGAITAVGELIAIENTHLSLRVKLTVASPFAAGDVIVANNATVSRNDVSDADKKDGLCAIVSAEEAIRVDTFDDLSLRVARLRERTVSRICNALPGEEGAFLSALLLGEREYLSESFTRDMTRIGTIHMLALSGLHIVVLSTAISFLLRRLRLGRRIRELFLVAFFIFFMMLTGFSASVMRACFMYFVSVLATAVRAERDSFTSLSAACAVICLAEPYAVTDLSLWLSALATLGILLAFEGTKRNEEQKPLSFGARILRGCFLSLIITLAATAATLPLTALFFGQIPLISPLANLLLSPLIQLALYLAALVAIFGAFPPLCALCRMLCSCILELSARLARVPNTVLSVASGAPLIITLCFFFFLLLYVLFCPKDRFLLRIPLSLLLICSVGIAGTLGGARLLSGDDVTLTYRTDDGCESDLLLLETEGKSFLFTAGAEGYLANAVQTEMLAELTELDGYVLLSYREGVVEQLSDTLACYTVFSLYLPAPQNEGERFFYEKLCDTAKKERIPVQSFGEDELFLTEGVSLSLLERTCGIYGETEQLIFRLTMGSTRLLYFSGESLLPTHAPLTSSAHVLLFGAFGGAPLLLFEREDFLSGQRVLCASALHFPFYQKDGVAFAEAVRYTVQRDAFR